MILSPTTYICHYHNVVTNITVTPIYSILVIAILCALSGIVAFALPVPGIIARFQDEQEQVS